MGRVDSTDPCQCGVKPWRIPLFTPPQPFALTPRLRVCSVMDHFVSLCEPLTHTLSATPSAFAVSCCLFDRLELEVKHVANAQRPLCAKIARLHETLLLFLSFFAAAGWNCSRPGERKSDYLNAEGTRWLRVCSSCWQFSVAADANLGNNGMLSRTSQRLHSDWGCSRTTTLL